MSTVFHEKLKTVEVASGTESDPIMLEAIVRKLADGSLFMSWTGGGQGEPEIANVTKFSTSHDGGATWSGEQILLSHPSKGIFTPCLFTSGNALYAFSGSYYNETNFAQDMQSYMTVSLDCGKTFLPPASLSGCINNVHIKCGLEIADKWLFACSWIELDGDTFAPPMSVGGKKCIVGGRELPLSGDFCSWNYKNHTEYCGLLVTSDKGKSWSLHGRLGRKGLRFVEPMLIDLSDGTLVILLRTDIPFLYESRSHDGGLTWSEPIQTGIPSAITKVKLLKDSVGRIYLLHNPNPHGGHRSPLSLWISNDDMQSWSTKIDLASDSKRPLCYPDGFIDEEKGMLCISWDDRRNVFYSEISISGIRQ